MGFPLSFYHPMRAGAVALRLARGALGAGATDTALIERAAVVRSMRYLRPMQDAERAAFEARMAAVLANADLRRYVDGGDGADLARGLAAVGA